MKQWYKTGVALMMIACAAGQISAQTQFGNGAGTVGANRAFFGTNAGKVNTGSGNTFLGHGSGLVNLQGGSNTFVGSGAGSHNSSGNFNNFIGSNAGQANETGGDNFFGGVLAGANNVSGSENIFIGTHAGLSNKTGSKNISIGFKSNIAGDTGEGNCTIGWSAGYYNKGINNVFVGINTGSANSFGKENVFVGNSAGKASKDADFNTFLGSQSGFQNVSGSENTFLGNNAGYLNISGASNTFVGTESGYAADAGSANAFLGKRSGYSNKGNNNAFFGYGAGYDNTTGDKNTYLGYASGGLATLINATAIGAQAKVTANNSLVLGDNANVGIGVSAPTHQLHLSTADAFKAGNPSWIIPSDLRLKKDVSDFSDGLAVLKQIKPIWFSYNGKAGIDTKDQKFVGVIAQEMQKIAPYTIGTFNYQDSLGNKTEYLDYDANAVTYILINSVKEQQEIIEQKEAKIQEITSTVTELSKRLEQLERIVASGTIKPTLTGNPAAKTGNEPNANGVILEQNAPNGFSQSTSIQFFIPQSVKEAVMNIYSTDGVKVGSYPVNDRGQASLTLSAKTFQSGVFIYDLITDGKSNGAKKMVVTQ